MREFLVQCWHEADVWHRAQDWGPQHGLAPESYEQPHMLEAHFEHADEPVDSVERLFLTRPSVLAAYRRVMYHMTVEERLSLFAEAKAEYAVEAKARKKEFAKR